ncbi:MAG: Magnesium chelatase, subunit ChlI, partial [uncultured Thermomicrobiales bacterium]
DCNGIRFVRQGAAEYARRPPRFRVRAANGARGDAREPDRQDPQRRRTVPRRGRVRPDGDPPGRERDPLRPGHHPARRAGAGQDPPGAVVDQSARRGDPDRLWLGDQRRPAGADLEGRPRPDRRARRRDPGRVDRARPPLRREAGDPGHDDRRPDRRGRPDQGRRGALPLRRVDHLLRPDPAHQPRRLHPQRAAGPGGADPGRFAQHHGRARRPNPGVQDPVAAGRLHRRLGQPRGLHQPGPDHHPAQGPLRLPDPDPLPGNDRAGDGDHGPGADRVPDRRGRGHGAGVHERDRGRVDPRRAAVARHLAALRRFGPDERRQLREPDLQRHPALDPVGREAGGAPDLRPGWPARLDRRQDRTRSDGRGARRAGGQQAAPECGGHHLQPPLLGPPVRATGAGVRQRAARRGLGHDAGDGLRSPVEPPRRDAGSGRQAGRRRQSGGGRVGGRVRPRRVAPQPPPEQGRGQGTGAVPPV